MTQYSAFKPNRRWFKIFWEAPFEHLLQQGVIRPDQGAALTLRRNGLALGKYIIRIDGNEHSIEIGHRCTSHYLICEQKSIQPVYRLLRETEKYLRSQMEERAIIRPILPQPVYDLIESAVFDFFTAIDDLETTRGFGNVGFILTGPPGVGKSETMRWLREESHVNYKRTSHQLSLAELHKVLAEGVPLNVSNALFFIDDIDANLLRDRRETKNPLTSQFLTCLDGLDKQEGRVMVISTNEKIDGGIDPALLRPGRFDHVINFEYPTLGLIEQFCETRDVDLNPIMFDGWSFARIDMFLSKFKVAEYLHGATIAGFYEKFIHEMGEADKTVEAHEKMLDNPEA